MNPFAEEQISEEKLSAAISDEVLIAEAVAGDKDALETLVKRHQNYIYNVSLKLFLDPDDALDATQEVLIKVITRLNNFHGTSQFKTWLYRIAVNHFLNSPARKMEQMFERGFNFDSVAADQAKEAQISEAEVEEVRVMCSTAMLMCLNREQRLIYIIGEIFEADHKLGAELFDITPGNFRVRLHRAKSDLLNYVTGKCGLIDAKNSCRCHKKARVLIGQGVVDKNNLRFTKNFERKINQIVHKKRDETCDRVELKIRELFQDSPFNARNELDAMFANILRNLSDK